MSGPRAEPERRKAQSIAVAAAVVVVSAVVALNAWVCDDAFITLRTAAQFWAGEGLVFNQSWRVQAYTHPAWMVLVVLGHGLTGEGFWTLIGLSLATTAVGIYVAARVLPDARAVAILVAALISSRAFVEYACAGLENPATHLVVIVALGLLASDSGSARIRLRRGALLLAAAFLCRPDAVLLLAPMVVALLRDAREADASWTQILTALAPGVAAVLAWEGFSLVYYGAWLPNTALAKLGVGLDRGELIGRGLGYVLRPLSTDPVTALLVVAGIALPFMGGASGTERARLRPLALGSALYLIYVVAIGGDFMAGRFLTAPAVLGALILARVDRWRASWAWTAGLALVLIGLAGLGTRHPLVPDRGEAEPRSDDGIADERSFYAAHASLLVGLDGRPMPDHPWRARAEALDWQAQPVVQFNTMGYFGYFAPLEVHVVDGFALADPLLARLPPVRRIDWKAGHLARIVPDGYLHSLTQLAWARAEGRPGELATMLGANQIRDPAVAALYDDLVWVHTAPLLARERWAAMVRLWRGDWRATFEPDRYALAELERVSTPTTRAWLRRPKRFRDAGIELRFGRPQVLRAVELELSLGQTYSFEWRRDGEVVSRELAELAGAREALGLIELIPERPEQAYDALRIVPQTMHGARSLALRRARIHRR